MANEKSYENFVEVEGVTVELRPKVEKLENQVAIDPKKLAIYYLEEEDKDRGLRVWASALLDTEKVIPPKKEDLIAIIRLNLLKTALYRVSEVGSKYLMQQSGEILVDMVLNLTAHQIKEELEDHQRIKEEYVCKKNVPRGKLDGANIKGSKKEIGF